MACQQILMLGSSVALYRLLPESLHSDGNDALPLPVDSLSPSFSPFSLPRLPGCVSVLSVGFAPMPPPGLVSESTYSVSVVSLCGLTIYYIFRLSVWTYYLLSYYIYLLLNSLSLSRALSLLTLPVSFSCRTSK